MVSILVTLVHVLVSLFLIGVVLLQTGKRADLAGAFGGGGSQTAFGARGTATVLSKATTIAAILFMLTSLTLAIRTTQDAKSSGSVLEGVEAPVTAPAPEQPAPTGPVPSDGADISLPPVEGDAGSSDAGGEDESGGQ